MGRVIGRRLVAKPETDAARAALASLTGLGYIAPAGIDAPAATERWLSG